MKKALRMRLVVVLVAAMTMVACTSSSRTTESTGEYVDDAAITSRVKAVLFADSGLKSFDIGVETYKDVVQLSGFVNSGQVKAHAGDVAAENNLVVK
jgi:osmotically-inducible protein OsmY